ncbi:hypothetical protein Vadar_023754 [Vaccinium darrowii]|uniref:Uncharacterized protein n=1 Tax=Vaccinium darrowii TaxID=229202 RepID=A0ACB7X3K0_9ERIC|nr:hypothetical protein Vadar_023754 [Vaccinium darrowii]
MIIVVHFHLHNHIMVGTKKTKDVQFYVQVMDVVQTLWGQKRSAYEIVEEQRERDRRNKINLNFQNFVNRINDLWVQTQFKGLDLKFDQPLRELGLCGVMQCLLSLRLQCCCDMQSSTFIFSSILINP